MRRSYNHRFPPPSFSDLLPQVKFLIQNGADVRARAYGSFFQSGSPVYFGEYPMSFAACTGQKDIVSYLKRHGALVNEDKDNRCVARPRSLIQYRSLWQILKERWCDTKSVRESSLLIFVCWALVSLRWFAGVLAKEVLSGLVSYSGGETQNYCRGNIFSLVWWLATCPKGFD